MQRCGVLDTKPWNRCKHGRSKQAPSSKSADLSVSFGCDFDEYKGWGWKRRPVLMTLRCSPLGQDEYEAFRATGFEFYEAEEESK